MLQLESRGTGCLVGEESRLTDCLLSTGKSGNGEGKLSDVGRSLGGRSVELPWGFVPAVEVVEVDEKPFDQNTLLDRGNEYPTLRYQL